jgi:hypothetical protein
LGNVTLLQDLFFLENFDPHQILRALSSVGATALRILREEFRVALLHEAEGYSYTPEPEVMGRGDRVVRQQVETCSEFVVGSYYLRLRDAFQQLCAEAFANANLSPFACPLSFNALALQRYQPGALGITPHRDGPRYINLVCVFIIGGQGRFAVCADRAGRAATVMAASLGNVILMRAPGFLGSAERPFHSVTDIQQVRYTFGLRQQSHLTVPL